MASLMQKIKSTDFKIYDNRKLWYIIPMIIIVLTLILCTVFALVPSVGSFANIGIDFQGGTVMSVAMSGADMNTTNYDKNLELIEGVVVGNGLVISVRQASGTNGIIVRYTNVVNGVSYNSESKAAEMTNLNSKIKAELETAFKEAYPEATEVIATFSLTSASASSKLLRTAFLSIGIAVVVILIYIMFRFDFFSGLSAIITMMHDIILMLAFTLIFRIQLNSSFVAGVITIVGYSINNTIIVFDRIRDNKKPYLDNNQKLDVKSLIDTSVMQTMTRSIYTSLTTLITIAMLAIIGVPSIREFSLPIIFGLFAGFYSSVFLAPNIWGEFVKRFDLRKKPKAKPAESKKEDKEDSKDTSKPGAPKKGAPKPPVKGKPKAKAKAKSIAYKA